VVLVELVVEPLPLLVVPEESVQGLLVVVVVVGTQGWPDASLPSVSTEEHSTQGLPFWSLPSVSLAEHSGIEQVSTGVLVDVLEEVLVEEDEEDGDESVVAQSTGGGTSSLPPP
jgi:hypothetical protein